MIQDPYFWLLLAVTVPAFWLLPVGYRMGFLALTSAVYLATLDWRSVAALAVWSVAFYWMAPMFGRKDHKGISKLAFFIVGVLGVLAYFKYLPPLLKALLPEAPAAALLLPLGISYYTFKLIHYGVECARGNIQDRSFATFAAYLFLVPIFTAGPIERFDHFLANRAKKPSSDMMLEGIQRVVYGMIKQLIIADYFILRAFERAGVSDISTVLQQLDTLPASTVWTFLILTYIYTYVSFSAYTDIAIGASRMYGFRIMENFNFPIIASNFANLWKRWHMTLASWCQAYVYMPILGLTRNPYFAVIGSFLAIGLWHGGSLNWVCWGLYNGVGVAVVLTWGRIQRKRRWTFMKKGPLQYAGIPVTFLCFAGSFAFTATDGLGVTAAGRLLLRAVGL